MSLCCQRLPRPSVSNIWVQLHQKPWQMHFVGNIVYCYSKLQNDRPPESVFHSQACQVWNYQVLKSEVCVLVHRTVHLHVKSVLTPQIWTTEPPLNESLLTEVKPVNVILFLLQFNIKSWRNDRKLRARLKSRHWTVCWCSFNRQFNKLKTGRVRLAAFISCIIEFGFYAGPFNLINLQKPSL